MTFGGSTINANTKRSFAMERRYWVIGGDYSDCDFGALEPGSAAMV